MAERLVAWLHDTPVASLAPGPEFRIHLDWCPEGIERWGFGSPALSVGLRIGSSVGSRDMRGLDFFENMLPEGPALARMAVLAGVRPVDTYGILRAFGRDCAGAIVLLPDGEQPGGDGGGGYTPMTSGDLRHVISALVTTVSWPSSTTKPSALAAASGSGPRSGYRCLVILSDYWSMVIMRDEFLAHQARLPTPRCYPW